MTRENKELLLKDLSARLPYGVRIHIDYNENGHTVADATLNTITSITGQFFDFTDFEQDFKNGDCCPISGFGSNKHLHLEEIKPYLRPMSSMTEVEKCEYCDLQDKLLCSSQYPVTDAYELFDWLNSHHFDHRGLIPMGLALEAPKDMYKTE